MMMGREKLDSIPNGHDKAKPLFLSSLHNYLWDHDTDAKPEPGAGAKVGPNQFVMAVATKASQ
jgi:hypothetical protein